MQCGYNGRILRVNLSKEKIEEERPAEDIYRMYMGGSAMSLYLLLKELRPGLNPLEPENKLIFMSNVLSGVAIAGLSRYTVAARSPLTGAFGEAEAGGFWGPELKHAGFDGVIIEGRSKYPVYLWIKNGDAQIRDATNYWGKDTGDVQRMIREELSDQRIRVAQCGRAGENLVRYACVFNELKHANGRTGMGAVMGSKNLRAVAVRGTQKLQFSDPVKVKELKGKIAKLILQTPSAKNFKKYGTAFLVRSLNNLGILPTRNFTAGVFEGAEDISGEVMSNTILKEAKGCYACPIHCKRAIKVEGKYSASPQYGGPEYETLASLGSLCGINSLEAISHGNDLCNHWGLDTISTGLCIAFAMECTEQGILTQKDTDGIDLRFGNADSMIEMIRKIAFREGFGAILADGVKLAAEKIGKGAEKYAMHIKGQELPAHDPRGKHGLSLGYATSPTGADHMEAPHDTSFLTEESMLSVHPAGLFKPTTALELGPKKIRQFIHTQQIFNFYNSLGICYFVASPYSAFTLPLIAETVKAVIGWNTSVYELMELGERTITMARMFNLREGFTNKDDFIPDRLFERLEQGTPKEKRLLREDFINAIRLYYEAMGWEAKTGIPTDGRLAFLGLEWLINVM